ncbi:hypothetical protein QNI19_34725 [Cytophagaceae bacterium DM2B3-1]|uniref:Tetratricopeptide repeat protein n=1 Tax=Xanthocytophaga flava TaxID=3048013 RepID=A0ABT7CWL6_9BACT|nr:hypothetical protein [Xanthocytophaga flavus]MDJ1498149.1 hypothetical protein [Xanthocytophaga flavus]
MHKKFHQLFIALLLSYSLHGQSKPTPIIVFLSNDKIAEVNINQDKYIQSIKAVLDLAEQEFATIPASQEIAILLVGHKTGKPTIKVYSKPKLRSEQEEEFLKKANSIPFENTKLVDFPLLISFNIKDGMPDASFENIELPEEKKQREYQTASLEEKYRLLKNWATSEVLPVLSTYQTIVDDKFAGVKSFGTLVSSENFSNAQNITALTSQNPTYWRATLEMSAENQLIPISKIFLLISQGQFDHAIRYMEIVQIYSDSKSIANSYLKELSGRLQLFNQQLNASIQEGIAQHDKGNYQKAIEIYTDILQKYPNSAWALYELYYSQNMLAISQDKQKPEDRSDWDHAKASIFKANPLYSMDVRASNAKEGYLLFRRQEIGTLFKDKKTFINDTYKYADIAMDLEIYDFAAQLFWYSVTYSKDKEREKALNRFLFCLEKLGVTTIKQNFTGDFDKEFKKIETEKEKEMKANPVYKAFKK